MDFKNVKLTMENRIGIVTIDHPPANALNADTLRGLSDCIDYIQQTQEIKVVIITGSGRFFIAGADIKEFPSAYGDPEKGRAFAENGQQVFNKIEQMDKPVIAAINGAALGGGFELALSCHLRIASDQATLGLPELKLGLIPGFGGTQRLARLTNKAKALELILTSQFIDGKEAEKQGIVNLSVPQDELMATAKRFAEMIAEEKSAPSLAAAIQAVSKGVEMPLEEGQKLEAELFAQMFDTEDVQEGVSAFIEKRKAEFKDK